MYGTLQSDNALLRSIARRLRRENERKRRAEMRKESIAATARRRHQHPNSLAALARNRLAQQEECDTPLAYAEQAWPHRYNPKLRDLALSTASIQVRRAAKAIILTWMQSGLRP